MRTHFSSEIASLSDGSEVTICGWVHETRTLGGISFCLLRDKEGTVQIAAPRGKVAADIRDMIGNLQREDVLQVTGRVVQSKVAKSGVEILPLRIVKLNSSKAPLPLDTSDKVQAELETRLDARFLDLRRSAPKAIFNIQNTVLKTVRSFFADRGFLEVSTPKILGSATEGGAALFKVDYYGRNAFLAQSPQLYKEVLTSSLEKVYEIASYFRAELSDTTYHLAEFTSVDMEEAFASRDDAMRRLEELVALIFAEVAAKHAKELQTLGHQLTPPSRPFKKLTYTEVLELLKAGGIELQWGADISTPELRGISDTVHDPYFVMDWPTVMKPFYIQPKNENPAVCEAFDLNMGFLELASGGRRVHERVLLERRLMEQGLDPDSFRSHLDVFDYGMPPHAGWALGLGRLMMILTGAKNIRDVVLFARDRNRLTP